MEAVSHSIELQPLWFRVRLKNPSGVRQPVDSRFSALTEAHRLLSAVDV